MSRSFTQSNSTQWSWSLFYDWWSETCSLLLTRQRWSMWHWRRKQRNRGRKDGRRQVVCDVAMDDGRGWSKWRYSGLRALLIWPETVWRQLMSREHIALCLPFLFTLYLTLHCESLISSPLSLRPPSLPKVPWGQGLCKGIAKLVQWTVLMTCRQIKDG